MKCKNCGAETEGEVCEYCGTPLASENTGNQTCPKCGSSKLMFKRERQGSINAGRAGKRVNRVYYETVGVCQACGFTWTTDKTAATTEAKKSHGFWWWVLIICFWPISLSVWFWKTDKINIKKKWKALILAVVWILLFSISGTNNNSTQASTTTEEATQQIAASAEAKTDDSKVFTIVGEELGDYGKTVILNADSDMPVTKYLYKLPAGEYSVTTTTEKYASFYIVKDEVADTGTPPYSEELQYVGEDTYLLTTGSDDLNGKAKNEVEISLAEDESVQTVGTDTFIFTKIS